VSGASSCGSKKEQVMPNANDTLVGQWLRAQGFNDLTTAFYAQNLKQIEDVDPDKLAILVTPPRRAREVWDKWPKPEGWENPVTAWLGRNRAAQFAWPFYKNSYRTITSLSDDVIDELVTEKGLRPDLKSALKTAQAPVAPENEVTVWLNANGAQSYAPAFAGRRITALTDVTDKAIDDLVTQPELAGRLKEARPIDAAAVAASALTDWLKSKGAAAFANAFYRLGHRTPKDVTEAAIEKIVRPRNDGVANTLAAELKRAHAQAPIPELAKLPDGHPIDISAPKQLDPQGVAFELPKSLGPDAATGEVKSLNAFLQTDWLVMGDINGMFHGYNMDGARPARARAPVYSYTWRTEENYATALKVFAKPEFQASRITTDSTSVEQSHDYVAEGFDKKSAEASFPYAALSVSRSVQSRRVSQQTSKKLCLVGRWSFPKVTLYLTECTVLSRSFLAAVDEALGSPTPEARTEALGKVFSRFGHAVANEVLLGCELYYKKTADVTSTLQEEQQKETFQTSARTTFGSVSAGVSTEKSGGSTNKETGTNSSEHTSFDAHGGNATMNGNPGEWIKTTLNPMNWAVIEKRNVVSTVSLLDPDRKARVLAAWKPPSLLGDTRLTWANEVEHTAPADGFVGGTLWSYSSRIGRAAFYCHSGSNKERRGLASVHTESSMYGPGIALQFQNRGVNRSSFFVPVRKGEKVTGRFESLPGSEVLGSSLQFLGTSNEEGSVLGEAKSLFVENSWWPVKEDGFFLCALQAGDGMHGRGMLRVFGPAPNLLIGTASVHWSSGQNIYAGSQSFCVPLRKDQNVDFILEKYQGNPSAACRWIPLQNAAFGQTEEIEFNTTIEARTDGFVVAWLETDGQAAGYIDLGVGATAAEIPHDELATSKFSGRVAATCVDHNPDSKRPVWLSSNTVTAPVRRNSWYRVSHKGTGTIKKRAYWVPLV
jgi:hypothetical protein